MFICVIRHIAEADGEILLVALLFANGNLLLKQRDGAARLAAEAVGVRQCVQRPCLIAFILQARRAIFAVREEGAQQFIHQLICAKLIIQWHLESGHKTGACLIILPGADGVVIQFNHGLQVVQRLHLVRLWHGGEVIAQLGVGGGAIIARQAVVGIAPHDGVQVEAVLFVAV